MMMNILLYVAACSIPITRTAKYSACKRACQSLPLPCDAAQRRHLCTLQDGDVEAAQEQKSELEQLQRHDKALRSEGRKAAAA